VKHGVPCALLLGDLSWQFLPFWNSNNPYRKETSIKDNAGEEYYPLNPVLLTAHVDEELPILPMSRWTLTRRLKLLKSSADGISEHTIRKHYYRFRSAVEAQNCQQLSAKVEGNGAIVASDGAIIADHGAKVADFLCIDSNEIVVEDSRVFSPDTAPASPPLCGVQASPSLRLLLEIGNKVVQDLKQNGITRPRITTVPASQLPYDVIGSPQYDLPYEYIPLHPWTGRPYMRSHQVRDWMEDIAMGWRLNGFRYTRRDLNAIADIFLHVHTFNLDHFEELSEHVGGWGHNIFTGGPVAPSKKGEFDPFFFARKVKSAATLVKYLPQLIDEMHTDIINQPGETKEWEKTEWVHGAFEDVLEYLRPVVIGTESVPWDSNPTAEVPFCSREDYIRAAA
jgi:hypothetical protein